MGNACTIPSSFDAETLGKVHLEPGQNIASDTVASKPTSLKISGKAIIDAGTGATLYVSKMSIGLNTCTITIKSSDGHTVCVAKGRKGFTTGSFKILRPGTPAFAGQESEAAKKHAKKGSATLLASKDELYAFAEGSLSLGFGSASCNLDLVTSAGLKPLYSAKKLRALPFLFRVEHVPSATLVGTVAQKSAFDHTKLDIEVAMGMDMVALLVMSAMTGAATSTAGGAVGGCSNNGHIVGGLVGAGAI